MFAMLERMISCVSQDVTYGDLLNTASNIVSHIDLELASMLGSENPNSTESHAVVSFL